MHSDSLSGVYLVQNKLLITYQASPIALIPRVPLAWLDQRGQIIFWELNATAFKVEDNNLYYATYDALRQDWNLNLYDETPLVIHQKKGLYVMDITVDTFNGYEYFGVRESGQGTAIVTGNAANRKERAIYYPWGSVFMPVCVKDSSGNLFLLKNQTYAPEKKFQVFRVLEKIDNGTLKLVDLNKDGDAAYHQVYQDRIYFTLRHVSGTLNGIYYVGSDNRIKQIFTGPIETFSIQGKYLVTSVMEDGNPLKTTTTVMKATDGKVLHIFKRAFATSTSSNGALALFSEDQVVVVRDTARHEMPFALPVNSVTPASKGFVIIDGTEGNHGAHYYYVKTEKLVRIAQGKEMMSRNENPLTDLVLFYASPTGRENYIWDTNAEKLIAISPQDNISGEINANLFLGNRNENYNQFWIYAIENDKLSPKYHIDLNPYSNFLTAGNSNYASGYESTTGNEMIRLEKDSVYHFPEVVKGSAGITLRQVFHFKNNIYAVGFTNSNGLQVWKMGAVQEEQKVKEETEAAEVPKAPGHVILLPEGEFINVYPNPAVHELNIDLKSPGLIKIIDLKGLEVFQKQADSKTWVDLKDLASGAYLIIVKSHDRTIVKKMIKR